MSVNRKPPASNGRLQSNMKSWKVNEPLHGSSSPRTCRRKPFLIWFFGFVAMGSVWFILSFNTNYLVNKENEAICEKRAGILLQRYNVSREQIYALASLFPGSDQILFNCIDERRLRMLLSSGMVSTPQLMCPENQELRTEHLSVADTVEPIEQCPILNDYVQNIVQPWEMRVSAIWGHVSSSNLTKGFWWVLTGIIISYFCLLRRSQKQKMVQGHPAPQQKRLKHFPRGPSRGAGREEKKC